ncbi:translation initiation factor IF-2 N-terminal domain-containing protein [Nocardia asteroides]|uniref:translation initiation factor IF-2 N-terminal domain-containing protein n=1 Tax=Nocardia asteroides TaxID=1824 RepID=UPI001E4AFD5B|nr:translation initiation factor IF-2 N-terminal domain-containing protein [Nocardia asteroides]UGT55004.1 translation initiation factor IF-2 N-terminal domain-containing protein [Nocardia asteroides]
MAGKARVHELAKELGVTSKELLAKLREQGEVVRSASSTVEPSVARRLRESLAARSAPVGDAKQTAARPGPSAAHRVSRVRADGIAAVVVRPDAKPGASPRPAPETAPVAQPAAEVANLASVVEPAPSPLATTPSAPRPGSARPAQLAQASGPPPRPGSRAVLIGAATYIHPDLTAIPAALNNLADLTQALTSTGGAFAPQHCIAVPDPVSGDQIGHAVAEAAREATDVLFVYYAGHGVLDSRGRLYLAVTGTDPSRPTWTSVSFQTLREEILESRATMRVLILDCCYSGRAFEAMSDVASVIAGETGIYGTYTITSSKANEASLAPLGHRNTAFTAALLAAAQTAELTLDELYLRTEQYLIDHGYPRPSRRAVDAAGALILLGDTQEQQFRRASETGDTSAMVGLGNTLWDRGEVGEAETWYRRAAGLGDTDAMNSFGRALMNRGEFGEAETWFRRAADKDNPVAMASLGDLLNKRGEFGEAETWFRRAADKDNPFAMGKLGDLLRHRGEFGEAETWFRRAADKDNAFAMAGLGLLLRHRGEVGEAETWYRRAADKDNSFAMGKLGDLLNKRGEVGEAETWYRRAADKGSSFAMAKLGELLNKRGEVGEAETWYRRAADKDNPLAMVNLGILLNKRGEVGEAETWFRRAADKGSPIATHKLKYLSKGDRPPETNHGRRS